MAQETFCDSCGKTNTGKSWWEIHASLHHETAETDYGIDMDICQSCVVSQKFLKAKKK